MDHLRNEVADRPADDLNTASVTAAHLVHALTEDAPGPERSDQPLHCWSSTSTASRAVNDTYGHAAATPACKHFTLMAPQPGCARRHAGALRGDEFCIVLPSSTFAQGAMIARGCWKYAAPDAEQCIAAIFRSRSRSGCRAMDPGDGGVPDRLDAAADHALYDAKKAGR